MAIVLYKMRVIFFAREVYVNIRIVRGGHVENLDKSLKQQVLQNYTGGSGGCQLEEGSSGRANAFLVLYGFPPSIRCPLWTPVRVSSPVQAASQLPTTVGLSKSAE